MYLYDFETQTYSKKSYLELFLENSSVTKKRGIYFGKVQEQAILKYNDENTSEDEKNKLFETLVGPAFKRIISGVLEMPNFHNLGKLNREELVSSTFFRLIEKVHRFHPGMIGKNGQPVKAYSYLSTVAKNFILEQKLRNEKILKNKADVESSIDLTILSEDTLKKMSNYDKQDVEIEDYVTNFNNTKDIVIASIQEVIIEEENQIKPDTDFIKLGYCLKYLINKWDKIEFTKKNEFMRILTLYTGLPQQKVSFLFKKFKQAALKNIQPSILNKKETTISISKKEEEEEEYYQEDFDESDYESDIPDNYEINTMEEFEVQLYKNENNKIKTIKKWTVIAKEK